MLNEGLAQGARLMAALDPRRMYRNRIDILKRIGKDDGPVSTPDPEQYRVMPWSQIVTRERLRQGLHVGRNHWIEAEDGKLYVNGELAPGE